MEMIGICHFQGVVFILYKNVQCHPCLEDIHKNIQMNLCNKSKIRLVIDKNICTIYTKYNKKRVSYGEAEKQAGNIRPAADGGDKSGKHSGSGKISGRFSFYGI